jgi:uncharacterized membrane protein YidH (DUF202 family)
VSQPAPGDEAPAEDIEEADPALARERTELAWTRSSIAFFALGVAILKFKPAAGIPILAFAAVTWLLGRAARTGNQWIAARRVPLVTVAVTALALVSLVLTLAGPASRGLRP